MIVTLIKDERLVTEYVVNENRVIATYRTLGTGLVDQEERVYGSTLEAVNHVHHWMVVALMGGYELE